jgi:hypothetical protein
LKTAPGGDKAAPTAGAIKFTPIDGGVSAEQGERLIKVFRLAKLLCNDCYEVPLRLPTKLGGKVIEVAGVQEASFIREILEQGKWTGGRMSTPEVQLLRARRMVCVGIFSFDGAAGWSCGRGRGIWGFT